MDFGALPPEVNSGLMYAGPGPEPLLAAATAWKTLAAELRSTATGYQATVSGLTGVVWAGPSSTAMAAAAAPYPAWLRTTAGQAEQASEQAGAAAAAYQTAFAATVPPPVIAANRSQLLALLATNVFGQHAAAIAAVEAGYAAMWAQDAATMYHYAGTAAAAAALSPFTPAPSTTNPAGQANQGGLSQLTGAIPHALQALTSPAPLQSTGFGLTQIFEIIESVPRSILPFNFSIASVLLGLGIQAKNLALMIDGAALPAAGLAAPALAGELGPVATLAAAGGPGAAGASAGLGGAGRIGQVSVPQTWAATAPDVRSLAEGLPGTPAATLDGAPTIEPTGSTALYGDVALANLAGSALVTGGLRGGVASAMNGHAPDRLAQFVAELSQQPGSQVLQHWHTDPTKLDDLLADLSKKPGIHAVHLKGGKSKPQPPGSQPGS